MQIIDLAHDEKLDRTLPLSAAPEAA
jgi:hypothetical protein